ncbi:SAF domain-containing protein, partial [Oleiphilus sp. HI0067]
NTTAIASVSLGSCVIEKHVTLDRSGGGPDDSFSLEEKELLQLCRDSKTAWEALGSVNYQRKKSEEGNATFRRSLYAVANIKAGEKLTKQNVRSIRPGFGLTPKELPNVLGKKAARDIAFGEPISWNLVK